jgi:hypothetical protein
VSLAVPLGVLAHAGFVRATRAVGALGIVAGTRLPLIARGTEVGVMFVAVEQVAGAHLTDRHGGQGSTGQLQWMRFNVPLTTDTELSPDEQALLLDAQTDDVSFGWVLIDIGLRENPPSSPDGLPGPQEIGSAFEALERLHSRGLIEVGRIEYRDGGSLGRVAPVRQVDIDRRRAFLTSKSARGD